MVHCRIAPGIFTALLLVTAACGTQARAGPTAASPSPIPDVPTDGAEPGSPAPTPRYGPPVVAPVLDEFRPPPGPFAAGNRGIEYQTEPGTSVGAISAGRVVFAGLVGGARHATVHHADGLRSSYSYLASITVSVGQRVESGGTVGTTTDRLHLGVRAGDGYLDPEALFGRDGVHLVPVR